MVEILETLAQILCPTPDSLSSCTQFINEFAYQGPAYQLLYFLFFPTIFIIVFIFVITRTIPIINLGDHKGIRLLMSLAIYAFIIINGWYSLALVLARVWFVLIIVLFGMWFFIGKHFGDNQRGGATARLPGIGGSLRDAVFGQKELDPRRIFANRKLLEDEIKVYRAQLNELEHYVKTLSDPKERDRVNGDISQLKKEISRLEHIKKQGLKYNRA